MESKIRRTFYFLCQLCCTVASVRTRPVAKPTPSKMRTGVPNIKLERVPPMTPQQVAGEHRSHARAFAWISSPAEPNICSPVAMAFDEAGQMYVVEMIDYSEKDKDAPGPHSLADETKMATANIETSKVFIDKLVLADGRYLLRWRQFSSAIAPDILYCKDTDGDGKADVRKVIYTGFGRKNVQGMLNTFLWGLDHKIYGQTSSSACRMDHSHGTSSATPLELRNRDFCFDPKTLEIEATPAAANMACRSIVGATGSFAEQRSFAGDRVRRAIRSRGIRISRWYRRGVRLPRTGRRRKFIASAPSKHGARLAPSCALAGLRRDRSKVAAERLGISRAARASRFTKAAYGPTTMTRSCSSPMSAAT